MPLGEHGQVSDSQPRTDLGATLRSLRRAADLSQRELAGRSEVPQATLARIESGRSADPGFRTVERLVRAAGGTLAITLPRAPAPEPGPVPQEELRDAAGRHCPAHLDAREVREPRDWPGVWWPQWSGIPRDRWPKLPAVTFRRNRSARDEQRDRDRVRRDCAVRRYADPALPTTSWRFVAELPDGQLIGELRAHERSDGMLVGRPNPGQREIVLDGVLVVPAYRFCGIGRRLVEALLSEMDRSGIRSAHAIAEFGDVHFLLACGFRLEASRPAALRLHRPVGARSAVSGGRPPPR